MNLLVVDIDGTLIEDGFGIKKDLAVFPQMVNRVKKYMDSGWTILFLSGRPETHAKETATLLFNLGFVDNDNTYLMLRPEDLTVAEIPQWKALTLVQQWNHFKPEEVHVYDNELPNLIAIERMLGTRKDLKLWVVTDGKAEVYY